MMKTVSKAWDWFLRRMPEVFLFLFLVCMSPLVVLVGRGLVKHVVRFVGGPGAYLGSLSDDPWLTAAIGVCIAGTALMVYVFARHWGAIWAVGRKTVREALHRKVTIVLLLFFVVLMPSLPFVLKTEGTPKSQVQLVLLYSLCLALVLMSLVAIFLTTASVCSEVEHKQVHITDTKPLRRWQFLLGKWFGVVVLCTVVLSLMTAGTYALSVYVAQPPNYDEMPAADAARRKFQQLALAREVFVTRRSVTIDLPDVSERVNKEVAELMATQGPTLVYQRRKGLTKKYWAEYQTADQNSGIFWRFAGLKPGRTEPIQIRFKAIGSTGGRIMGRFIPCWGQETPMEEDSVKARLTLRRSDYDLWSPPEGWVANAFHEFSLPARYISPEGRFYLAFENHSGVAVMFDTIHPIEVLQPEEGFLPNYYRAVLVLVCHVALLAALGLMAGSLFSFPVASLVVFCLFVGGMVSSWFYSEFVVPTGIIELSSVTFYLDQAWRLFATVVVQVMPDFGSFSPLGDLVNGRLVSLGHVSRAAAVLVFIKGGAALLIGMFFYGRRELARVIV